MRLRLLVVALAALLVSVVGATPAQAATAEGAYVNIQVDAIRSQSNMLVSFQKVPDGAIVQGYVEQGKVAGEGGNTFQGHEPQRVWVNPGWCAGFRKYVDTNTTYGAWTSWVYYCGGSTGMSVAVHPGNDFEGTWIVETYLSQNL